MKYWLYLNGEVAGSYEPSELVRVPDFSKTSLVCPIEGTAGERNWRHAGIFPEILNALEDFQRAPRPPRLPSMIAGDAVRAESEAMDAAVLNPNDMLQGATHRIFRHVTELMKEMENRREERSLTLSLERDLAQAKQELQAARERIRALEEQTSLLPGFEDREQKLEEFLERARADVKFRDHRIKELTHEIDQLRGQLDDAKQLSDRGRRVLDENAKLKQLEETLNLQLADKELTLAKALGILQRIEEELGHVLPKGIAGLAGELQQIQAAGASIASIKGEAADTVLPVAEPDASTPLSPSPTREQEPNFGSDKAGLPAAPREILKPEPLAGSDQPNVSQIAPGFPRPVGIGGRLQSGVTLDEGRIEHPVPLPPEEGVVSMAPTWKVALNIFSNLFRRSRPTQ